MLLLLALLHEAGATPRTRPVADETLAEELAELPWSEAERAMRLAVSEAMLEVDAPPPHEDWAEPLEVLEASRTNGPWQASWQLRVFDEAIAAGDVNAADEALGRAEQANGAPLSSERWRLFYLRIRTLLRQLAPWALAAVTAVGAGISVDTLASRRRRDPKTRVILNPYVTGRPLRDGKLVFGRDHILNTLVRGMREGRSYYLTGERRIGKTTLLLQIGELNRLAGGVSVFVDVAGSSGRQAVDVLERALRTQARAAGVGEHGSLLEVAERLAEKGPLRLMVDEVDALNQADEEPRALLRRIALGPDAPASMIAAGVGFDLDRDEEARRWRQHVEVLDVEPLSEEAARALLTEPVAGQVSWADAALDAVLEAADGRPMIIQLYGLNVVDRVGNQSRRKALLEDVSAVRPMVDKAWRSIQDHGLEDELIPVDIDMAQLELGRLRQEIDELERLLRVHG
ncbi:MAG: hypothetical protein H6741_01455 [Alphaproteobacteria bacterium]|nr:hypothetical protein [Alphaproteobacteria bacterium]